MKYLIVVSLVALAACGPTGDRADADRASGEQAVGVTDPPGPMANAARRSGDPVAKGAQNVVIPANVVAPAQTPPVTAPKIDSVAPTSPSTSIPDQFHGRWGLTAADCTSTRGDNKGLLVIGRKQLSFFEAKGTLARVIEVPAPNRFDASFNFTGEGMTWTRTERFDVNLDSLRRRTDQAPGGEPPVDLNYTRCQG